MIITKIHSKTSSKSLKITPESLQLHSKTLSCHSVPNSFTRCPSLGGLKNKIKWYEINKQINKRSPGTYESIASFNSWACAILFII
jgi:hypothetical protein